MYHRNLQTITGKLPVILNKLTNRLPKKRLLLTDKTIPNTNRIGTIISLFLLLPVLFLNGCDTSGSVGSDIITDDEGTETIEIEIDNYELLSGNTFSGRLPNTSVGYFEDPVYGTIRSVALIKPSISKTEVDTLTAEDKLSLNIVLNPTIYGDENGVSSFEIYETDEIWRGTQLKYNQPIDVDFGSKVGEFQVSAEDTTAMVELSDVWTEKFMEFHNSTSADRDSLYRITFPGLAVVPSESNQQIRFIKNIRNDSNNEDEVITTFVVEKPEDEESTENDEEDEEENDDILNLSVRDWGASFVHSGSSNNPGNGNFAMSNISHVLRLDPEIDKDLLASKNIVSAQLLLYKDTEPETSTPGIERPVTNSVRVHLFSEQPEDLMAEIFTTSASFFTTINDGEDEDEDEKEENVFRVNISQYIRNEVFGDADEQKLYLTIQSVNGILYSTHFFDQSEAATKPRIVITTVK